MPRKRREKHGAVAYILWFLFGTLGAHRYYFRRYKSGLAMLTYTLSSIALDEIWYAYGDHDLISPDTLFWVTFTPMLLFMIVDAFKIGIWRDHWNFQVRTASDPDETKT
ncbi:MAG: TM2 domain-containing protein [Litorimonas sp.]